MAWLRCTSRLVHVVVCLFFLAAVALDVVVSQCSAGPWAVETIIGDQQPLELYKNGTLILESNYTSLCSGKVSTEVWYNFVPLMDGIVILDTCLCDWDTVIEAQGGSSCDTRYCVGWDDDNENCNNGNRQSWLQVPVYANYIYNFRLRHYSAGYVIEEDYIFHIQFQESYYYCPSNIDYIYDYSYNWGDLTMADTLDDGCWNTGYWTTYGDWYSYTPASYSSALYFCSSYTIQISIVSDLCDYYGVPQCTDTYETYGPWYDSECEYSLTLWFTSTDTKYILISSFEYGIDYTISTYDLWPSSEDWSDDFSTFWMITGIILGVFAVSALVLGFGAFLCHRRTMRRNSYVTVPVASSTTTNTGYAPPSTPPPPNLTTFSPEYPAYPAPPPIYPSEYPPVTGYPPTFTGYQAAPYVPSNPYPEPTAPTVPQPGQPPSYQSL
ncbi:hypothetical protein Pelo_3821 [Pelomyxa schiedti]|nr:hypothetical protein Pelo_3821 [Pelomyxa schiedti]